MNAEDANRTRSADVPAFRYVVITPVRNEAAYIENTIQSMADQTVRPVEWIIVNDGSTDATEALIRQAMEHYPWIKLVNRVDRGARQRGKGVIEAFYTGYAEVSQPYDFIVKLDGDVTFQQDYFEGILRQFALNPKLGIAGGGLFERPDGKTWLLFTYVDEVRGATKVYRRTCFDAIGGLEATMGWDGIDEWSAHSLGWEVQSFVNLKLYHYRFTGAATGYLKSWMEQGRAAYFIGYHPLYILARGLRRLNERPYIIGGLGMVAAYFWSWMRRDQQYHNASVVRYVRETQLKKLAGLVRGEPVHIVQKSS